MPIIIDTCVWHKILPEPTETGGNYKVVYDWLYSERGKIVYGGAKYLKEIPRKYYGIIGELQKTRKVERCNDDDVDQKCIELKSLVTDTDFDDEHLIAIVLLAGAAAVFTCDARAEPYLKSNKFFTGANKPKILKDSTPQRDVKRILASA